MPARKVYGKSRSTYDPLAVFDSPQRRSPEVIEDLRINRPSITSNEPGRPARVQSNQRHRPVLGEIPVNGVISSYAACESNAKPAPGCGIRTIIEDSDDDDDEVDVIPAEAGSTVGGIACVLAPGQEERPDDVDVSLAKGTTESSHSPIEPCSAARFHSEHATSLHDESGQTPGIGPCHTADTRRTEQESDLYSLHCSELLETSAHGITSFSSWSEQLSSHFQITKIAEASFSEVYRLHLKAELSDFSVHDESVFKVIPLRPPEITLPMDKRKRQAAMKRQANMSHPSAVSNEVKLLHRMSNIPGFTNFRDVRVVQGRPPKTFVEAFKDFNVQQKARMKDVSLLPDPAKKTSYANEQLWAIIEMQDAGYDLEQYIESGQCTSIWKIWDIFWQVTVTLAKGEEGAEFEHRDLHLGNICVREKSEELLDWDPKRKLNFENLETTVIDYTISRARLSDDSVAYHDLAADNSLFEADGTVEYQYDIYRYMRGAVMMEDPYAEADGSREALPSKNRSWQQYHPVTNLIWQHFALFKLLEQVSWPSATKAPPRRQKEEHAKWKRANDLEHILRRVRQLLDPARLCRDELRSASDLIALALRECWLDYENIVDTSQLGSTSLADDLSALRLG